MTRLAQNKTVFKNAAAGNLDDLMSQKYAYRYGERLVFIKKIIYKDYAIPQEPRKEVNAIYDIFKVQVPYKIPLTTIEV